MKLLLVRHAPAGDKEKSRRTGKPDDLRPLTRKGRRSMRKAARGLRRVLASVDLLGSSPLARAEETAAIIDKAYDGLPRTVVPTLRPGSRPEPLLQWIKTRREQTIALVGHEPHLGIAIAYLTLGSKRPFVQLKKGQACLLEFDGDPRPGSARLMWSLAPRHLRRLGS